MSRAVSSGITCAIALAATTALVGAASAQSLTTAFNANNSFAGNMFNVNVLNGNLLVTGIDVNLTNLGSVANIEIWTRAGSYEASTNSAVGWTLVSSNTVTSAGANNPTFLDVTDFVLPGGETTGLFVYNPEALVAYTNAGGNGVVASNADLEITGGVGKGTPGFGGSVFTFRTWNGTIYYLSAPSVSEIAALSLGTSAMSRRIVSRAGGVAATQANDGLSLGEPTTTLSSRGTGPTGVNTWFEFTGFAVNGNDLRQTATGFQLGGDMHVMPNLALGLSIGHDQINSDAAGFDLSGDLTFLQPYLAYVSGPMRAEASLFYGRGDFEQISAGGTGQADTTVVAATISGAYDFALATGQSLSPMASLSFGEEESKGTGGTLAGGATETTAFGRASAGVRLTTPFDAGVTFVGVHADYDYSNGDTDLIAGFDDDTGLSGRVELGVAAAVTDRLNLRTSMSVGGLGTGTKDVAAGLRLSMSF